jgi:hypothetical protein
MVSLPVISDQAYFKYEKRIQAMRILSPLSLVGLFLLTLASGQAALFLLTLPLFAYYGYLFKNLNERKKNYPKDEILILDEEGAKLFRGNKKVWCTAMEDITGLEQKNAFRPAPDTFQQFIDELNGNPYESTVTISSKVDTRTLNVHIRSFHEGKQVRRWFGKGFEKKLDQRKTKSPKVAMSY